MTPARRQVLGRDAYDPPPAFDPLIAYYAGVARCGVCRTTLAVVSRTELRCPDCGSGRVCSSDATCAP